MESEAEKKAEIERILYARDVGENPILISLREAKEALREERDRWRPLKPPWLRPKRPSPKTPESEEKENLSKKDKEKVSDPQS